MLSGRPGKQRARLGRTSPWLVAGLAVLLLVACGNNRATIVSESVNNGGEATVDDLQKIVDQRAQAVLHHDQHAYLADLDTSNQRMTAQQRMTFANLTQFQFSDFHFVLDQTNRRTAEGNAKVTRFFPVVQIAQLAATDAGPPGVAPGESFEYDLTTKNGKWTVADLLPLTREMVSARGLVYAPPADAPWDVTPLKVVHVGDVWVAGDDSVRDLDKYAEAARAEVGRVEGVWGQRTRFPGYALFLSSNKDHLHAWYSLGAFIDKYEGVAVPVQGVRTNGQIYQGQYVGSRVVVNLLNIALLGSNPNPVMRHELTHAVTTRAMLVQSGGDTFVAQVPRWAQEGFARYVESMDNPAGTLASVGQGVRQGKFNGKLADSDHFYDGDDGTVGFNYDLGASTFIWIAQTRGQSTAVEFFARLSQYADVSGQSLVETPVFDSLCNQVLGMSASSFLSQWGAYVRGLGR